MREWWVDRKHLAIPVVASIVLASLHFFLLVWVPRDLVPRDFQSMTLPLLPTVSGIDEKTQALTRWMPIRTTSVSTSEREPQLLGIFISRGAGARASLVWTSSDGRPPEYALVAPGDIVEGWEVLSIQPKQIKLRKGEELRELLIFEVDASLNASGVNPS